MDPAGAGKFPACAGLCRQNLCLGVKGKAPQLERQWPRHPPGYERVLS